VSLTSSLSSSPLRLDCGVELIVEVTRSAPQ
jgi:hypothetical protein